MTTDNARMSAPRRCTVSVGGMDLELGTGNLNKVDNSGFDSRIDFMFFCAHEDFMQITFWSGKAQQSTIKLERQLFRSGRRIAPKFCTRVRI